MNLIKSVFQLYMSDEDFMIHVLNNLTEDYDMSFGEMESKLILKENRSKQIDN